MFLSSKVPVFVFDIVYSEDIADICADTNEPFMYTDMCSLFTYLYTNHHLYRLFTFSLPLYYQTVVSVTNYKSCLILYKYLKALIS